jgi:hypothetical protein
MPRHVPIVLVAALLALGVPQLAGAKDCTRDSTGLIPLTDLGTGTYQSAQGGLYAGGSNTRPAAHEATGLAIAHSIGPLDTLGNPDPAGRVVVISIGMSNATQEFSAFVTKAMGDAQKRPNVLVIDCAQGGQAANVINNPNAAYWDFVAARLRTRGSSPLQAQVVWIKEANAGPTGGFPAATNLLMQNLGAIVRIIKDKLPNVRLAYLTSRIYAGYATTLLNPEPYAYESGFAVKWLIDAQVQGVDSLEFDPAQGTVEAPWLSWGPYLWADGLEPRGDGMTWSCDAFADDGTHPSNLGRNIVADSLLAFFRGDATTVPWYRNGTVGVPGPRAAVRFTAGPSPGSDLFRIAFATRVGERWRLSIADLGGRRVRAIGEGIGTGIDVASTWDGHDDHGRRLPPGVYWALLESGNQSETRRVVLISR